MDRAVTAANAAATRTGVRRGAARPASRLLVCVTAVLLVLGVALTFMSWLAVDLTTAGEVLPEATPSTLISALDRGYSPHEMAGVGTFLATLLVLAASLVGLSLWRRASIWLLPAAALIALAGTTGLLLTVSLVAADAATGRFMPDDWDPYAPAFTVQSTALAFVAVCAVGMPSVLALWWTTRPRRNRS